MEQIRESTTTHYLPYTGHFLAWTKSQSWHPQFHTETHTYMKLRFPSLLLAGLCLLSSLKAQVVLTFEGFQGQEQVLNAYNGGTGSLGTTATNYGVSFSSNGLAISSGNFVNEPTPGILFFLSGSSTVMNVAAGFTDQFSFNYGAIVYTGSISVYDGLDGTGNLLATLALPLTPASGSAYDLSYVVGVTFSGLAKSVDFAGTANYIAFDNITLGLREQQPPTTPVPEPSTYGLMGAAALASLGCFRRLRRRAA